MLNPLFLYALLVISVLTVLLAILVVNLLVLPRLAAYRGDGEEPSVIALVPARNEAANRSAYLPSLLRQNYPGFEVWVYDDASTDETPRILEHMAGEHPNLRVVTASQEPPM